MKLLVLGATGRTGRQLLPAARAAGHHVTALVRDPAKLAVGSADTVVSGDVLDRDVLRAAAAGIDAVVDLVGPVPGQSTTIMTDTVGALLEVLPETGVRRLVVLSGTGPFTDGDDPLSRFVAKPILRRVLRDVVTDMTAMEHVLVANPLDWTIVRPPALTDRRARGRYRQRRDGNVWWGYTLSRADLAAAVLDLLADPTTVRGTVSVAR